MLLGLVLITGGAPAQAQTGAIYPFFLEAYDEYGEAVVTEIYWKSGDAISVNAPSAGVPNRGYIPDDGGYGSVTFESLFLGDPRSPLCGPELADIDPSVRFYATFSGAFMDFDKNYVNNDNAAPLGGTIGSACWETYGDTQVGAAGRVLYGRLYSGTARNAAGDWLVFDRIDPPEVEVLNDCTPDFAIRGPLVTVRTQGGLRAIDYLEPMPCDFTLKTRAIYRYVSSGVDTDSDNIPDVDDNCPGLANSRQLDADQDGIGDACDPEYVFDYDGDDINDNEDLCPEIPDVGQFAGIDWDGDGLGSACDFDEDGDGWVNPGAAGTRENEGICTRTEFREPNGPRFFYADGTAATFPRRDEEVFSNPDYVFFDECVEVDFGIIWEADNCPLISNPDQTPSALVPGRGAACEQLPPGC